MGRVTTRKLPVHALRGGDVVRCTFGAVRRDLEVFDTHVESNGRFHVRCWFEASVTTLGWYDADEQVTVVER